MPISARKEILKESYRNLPKHWHSQRGFLSFLAMAVMVSTAFGLDNSPTNQEAVLLWEKEFDEEVVDVIFGEAEMTVEEARTLGFKGWEQRKTTDIVKVQYPKVLMVQDENNQGREPHVKLMKFLDEKGNIKKELPIQRYIPGEQSPADINVSENKKYLCITSVKKWSEVGEALDGESVILNTDGDILWKTKHSLSSVKVSPNGQYVIGAEIDWGGYPLQIFYRNGLVREIKKDDQLWTARFSKDGSLCALTVFTFDRQLWGKKGANYYIKHLILFDDKGNELWRKENISRGEAAVWSRITNITDDSVTVFTVEKPSLKIYHFDKDGNLIKEE
jgi:hypothetical protein